MKPKTAIFVLVSSIVINIVIGNNNSSGITNPNSMDKSLSSGIRVNNLTTNVPIETVIKNFSTESTNNSLLIKKSSELVNKKCKDGYSYDSLETCRLCCLVNTNKSRCPKQEINISARYKNIRLNSKEYQITNQTLSLKHNLQNLSNTLFQNHQFRHFPETKIAIICFPLDKSLHTCKRELITTDLLHYYNDKSVHVPHLDINLTAEYYKKYFGGIAICRYEARWAIVKWKKIGHACSTVGLLITFLLTFYTLNRKINFPLLCYTAMYFFACTFLLLLFLLRNMELKLRSYGCPIIPLLYQFSFLSAFTWLNIHVFFLHSAFTELHVTNYEISRRRYFVYSAIGWGIPFVISGVTILVEVSGVKKLNPKLIPIETCNFVGLGSWFLYLYGPITLSLVLNLVFFVRILVGAKKMVKDVAAVNRNAAKQMFFMAVKLFIVMGFCYIMEIISGGVRVWGGFWHLMTVFSTFQGVYVLIAHICSLDMLRKFKRKCRTCELSEKKELTSENSKTTLPSCVTLNDEPRI